MTRYAFPPPDGCDDDGPIDWRPLDRGFLKDRGNADLPGFPLEILPAAWGAWVTEAAHGAGAPIDYLGHALLGAVAGLCGPVLRVAVTPAWQEPLQLCQVLVGRASAGRSPALAAVQRLLFLPADLAGLVWRDDTDWLADAAVRGAVLATAGGADAGGRSSLVACLDAETLADGLAAAGPRLAARLLYAWPAPAAPRPLAGTRWPPAPPGLEALVRLAAGAVDGPGDGPGDGLGGRLACIPDGLAVLDAALPRWHAEALAADGLEAAWLGKGRGTVVRLAAVLELLAWTGGERPDGPPAIGAASAEAACRLWEGYYRPHAGAVLGFTAASGAEQQARRVARWLHLCGTSLISREEVRCRVFGWRVSAENVDVVLARLAGAGVLRFRRGASGPRGGRPAHRWEVNPELATL